MCCEGAEPVNWEEIRRTPEQKDLLTELINIVRNARVQGATPFAGQLSAQPHQAQLDAMNVMGSIGGAGPYGVPDMPYWGTGPISYGNDYDWYDDDESPTWDEEEVPDVWRLLEEDVDESQLIDQPSVRSRGRRYKMPLMTGNRWWSR